LRPKTEKFSPHFFDVARLNFFQKGKENFSVLDFCLSAFGGRKQKGGSGAKHFIFSLFMLLVAIVPPNPTLATARSSL